MHKFYFNADIIVSKWKKKNEKKRLRLFPHRRIVIIIIMESVWL